MALVEVFNNGMLYELERSARHESSYFGGPPEVLIEGMPRRSRPLHHIVTLWNYHIDLKSVRFGMRTPCFYGLRYEGCELAYQRTGTAAINITSLKPRQPGDDYPYAGYPDLLPYVPLRLATKVECTAEQLSGRLYNTGWRCQPSKVYVVVPNPPDIGFTVWGPSGNDVAIVFEYDPEIGVMRACNQCT
jgi:hypothetical protein